MSKLIRCAAVAVVLLAACSRDADPAQPRPSAATSADEPAPMPLARTEVAGTTWEDGIAVVGGLTADGKASARADHYDHATNRWTRLPDLPVALHHATAVQLADRLFVIAGYTLDLAQWNESARVFSLARIDGHWREEPPLPAPRGAHAAAVLDGRIVVAGGVSGGRVAASSVIYDEQSGWHAGPDMARAREHLSATVADDRIYVIAGRANGLINFTDVESWDGAAATWRTEPALNDSRGGIGAATVNGAPCVAGGEETAGTIASIECLREGSWQRVARLARPRHGLAVAARGNALHVIGGGEQPGLFVSRVHERIPIAIAR